MDIAGLTPLFDACLLNPTELLLDDEWWISFVDPFRRTRLGKQAGKMATAGAFRPESIQGGMFTFKWLTR